MPSLGDRLVRRITRGSDDPTVIFRATTLLWFSILMWTLALAWGITHFAWGNVAIPILALGCAIVGIAAWAILLAGGRLEVACHVVLGAVWVSSVLGAFFAGGLRLTNVSPFFMLMIAAILLLGRTGLYWAVATALVALSFQAAHWTGFEFPDHVPAAERPMDAAFTWITTAGITLLLVFGYERSHRSIMASLHRANAAKSTFLGHVSHELRNSIHAVGLVHQSLLDGTLQDPQRRQVQVAQDNIAALYSFLADLVDLSAMEHGRFELRLADFSPVEVIEEIGRLGTTLCQTKGLEFALEPDAGVPARACGDRWRLRQILHNLVGNAVAHTSEGGVTVEAVGCDDGPDDAPLGVVVTVADTGDGIPREHQERIFEGFVRGPSNGEHPGAGLGLAICKQLVEAMHGTLELDSRPGQGTTISARVYFGRAAERAGAAAVLADAPSASARRLLLAEDSAANRDMAVLLLQDLGHEVVTARDGHEAVAMAKEQRFDLILMDVQMPRCDGIEATRRIRELELRDERTPVPIVAMTGNAVQEERQRYLDGGFSDCLFKPFTADELAALIDEHTA
ncbi:MAG: response regulator [Deltaproteobacteria bacterium]|jgi:signal transduction histidine kinase/ActR/RegA family two-component response regulator|nr:response regulator [Deltaproteobacteria bacterium]MBW2536620.1 response regulator [Deltaproteobacteria bacterium]